MSDRTAMFLGAVVFVVAVYYAQAFLVESWAHTHPDSTWAHALLNLKNGTGGE